MRKISGREKQNTEKEVRGKGREEPQGAQPCISPTAELTAAGGSGGPEEDGCAVQEQQGWSWSWVGIQGGEESLCTC